MPSDDDGLRGASAIENFLGQANTNSSSAFAMHLSDTTHLSVLFTRPPSKTRGPVPRTQHRFRRKDRRWRGYHDAKFVPLTETIEHVAQGKKRVVSQPAGLV
jgi:hypothetical protein